MSRITGSSRRTLAIVVITLAALLVGESVALAAVVTRNGKTIKAVKTATDTATVTTSSALWSNVPGMSLTMGVPSGEQGLLLVTFSANALCLGQVIPSEYCLARVLVDGTPASPGQVIFASDSAAPYNVYGTYSMQFVAGPLNAGQHTVVLQYRTFVDGNDFTLTNRTFTVLRAVV